MDQLIYAEGQGWIIVVCSIEHLTLISLYIYADGLVIVWYIKYFILISLYMLMGGSWSVNVLTIRSVQIRT